MPCRTRARGGPRRVRWISGRSCFSVEILEVRRRRVVADRVVPLHAQPRDPRLQPGPPDVPVQPVPELAGHVVPAPDDDPLAGADGTLDVGRPQPQCKRLLAGDDAVVARHRGQHGRVTMRISHRPTVLRPRGFRLAVVGRLWRRRTERGLWTLGGPANRSGSPGALSNAPLNPLLTRLSGSVVGLRGGYSSAAQPTEWPVERRFSQASTTRAAMPASAALPQARGS